MGFFDKAGKKFASVQKKTGDTITVHKLQAQVKNLNADIAKLYTAIGEKCYIAHIKKTAPEGVDQLFESVTAINDRIAGISAEIDRLSDVVRCEGCNSAVAIGVRFCPNCGTKMPEPPAPAVETCPECGAERAEGARFCENCGHCYDLPAEFVITPVTAPAEPSPAPAYVPGEEPTIAAPYVSVSTQPVEEASVEEFNESIDEIIADTVSEPEDITATVAPVVANDDLDDMPMTVAVDEDDEWFAGTAAIEAIDADKDPNA